MVCIFGISADAWGYGTTSFVIGYLWFQWWLRSYFEGPTKVWAIKSDSINWQVKQNCTSARNTPELLDQIWPKPSRIFATWNRSRQNYSESWVRPNSVLLVEPIKSWFRSAIPMGPKLELVIKFWPWQPNHIGTPSSSVRRLKGCILQHNTHICLLYSSWRTGEFAWRGALFGRLHFGNVILSHKNEQKHG